MYNYYVCLFISIGHDCCAPTASIKKPIIRDTIITVYRIVLLQRTNGFFFVIRVIENTHSSIYIYIYTYMAGSTAQSRAPTPIRSTQLGTSRP